MSGVHSFIIRRGRSTVEKLALPSSVPAGLSEVAKTIGSGLKRIVDSIGDVCTNLTAMEPPAYDEVVHENDIWDGDTKTKHHMSIRDEVGASRSQHVAVLVSKLMPQIRERAKHGLSNSTLLILPSDQGRCQTRTSGLSDSLMLYSGD